MPSTGIVICAAEDLLSRVTIPKTRAFGNVKVSVLTVVVIRTGTGWNARMVVQRDASTKVIK
jgi:hypothetical protein